MAIESSDIINNSGNTADANDSTLVDAGTRQPSEDRWASFRQARQDLREVLTDDELTGLGFDLTVLDEVP